MILLPEKPSSIDFTVTHFQHFLLQLIVLFMLIQHNSSPVVVAELLQRSTNMPSKNDTVFAFMAKSQVSTPAESLTEIARLYCEFLGSYSDFKKWTKAKLVFPEIIHPQFCEYFRESLLRSVGLQTTCEIESDTKSTKEGAKSNTLRSSRRDPVVFLHFLDTASNETTTRPYFLNHHEKSREILILAGNESRDVIEKQFSPAINTNYKWTLGYFSSNNSKIVQIEEIFGFATSSDPVPHFLGTWSAVKGVQIENTRLRGLNDFQGKLIRITSTEGNPVVYLDRNKTSGEVKLRGYLPDILDSLSLYLNFKYVLIEPSDKSFGVEVSPGNWSGMVGMLLRNEAEMALMSFSLTPQRKQVMDFSPPVERSSTRLLIRRDFEVSELKWDSFVSPFHWKVWFAIPFTIFLGVITLVVFTQYGALESTPLTSASLLFCCFLQQGMEGHSYFRKFPSRIVLGSFWVLAVVIYASYTARLTSFLAATTETLPFNSLYEAVVNRHWKIGLVRGSSFQDRVRDAPEKEMSILSKSLAEDKSRFVGGFKEGIDRVYNEKYIFFTSDLVPSFMVKGNCSFTWIPGKYFPGFGYMGYQKNLPFAPAISHRVAKIRESGQMNRLLKKWWGVEAACSRGNDAFVGMSLYETGTAFFIIIVGLSLAIFLFTGELIFRTRFKRLDSGQDLKPSEQDV